MQHKYAEFKTNKYNKLSNKLELMTKDFNLVSQSNNIKNKEIKSLAFDINILQNENKSAKAEKFEMDFGQYGIVPYSNDHNYIIKLKINIDKLILKFADYRPEILKLLPKNILEIDAIKSLDILD